MKITKDQLREIIKEELKEATGAYIPGKAVTLDFLEDQLKTWRPEALEKMIAHFQNAENPRFDLTEDVLEIANKWLATYTEHS